MTTDLKPAAARVTRTMPLTSCRACDSKLLQLERVWVLEDGRHAARRRCPECGCVDTVTAGALALSVWRKVAMRRLARLERGLVEAPIALVG